jgi:predicted dehydrogenase
LFLFYQKVVFRMSNKIRLGMIGGGQGAFIGAIHRIAANMDGLYDLVCGCFSSDAQKSLASGVELGLTQNRCYSSYQEMFEKENALPANERMQAVSIVTPNHVHFEPAALAMQHGYHVILDKPMVFSLAEAFELEKIYKNSNVKFCLTHTYTGYPMVKEAKQLITNAAIGKIRKVYVEYPQGWLSTSLETSNQKQASWRTNPSKSGIAGAMGDIGTHAFNLAEYVTSLQVTQLCADINIKVEGRQLDDDGAVLLKFNNGASGVLMATQIGAGQENNIKIRVFGEKGSITWQQEDNNSLQLSLLDEPTKILRAGNGYLSSFAQHNCRTPAGHPEGYLEAFANLYKNIALHILHKENATAEMKDYPGINDGIRGMLFIEKVIESGKIKEKWIEMK